MGGAVRDALLGLAVADRDWVVVGATPEAMDRAGYQAVGRDFPVFLHPLTKEEHALARTERKAGHGYHGFVFQTGPGVALADDLARRDLTINAIACDEAGQHIDPYNGRADLAARVLRHVSPAFVEDPVRILRLARYYTRFAPLGFTVADETRALCRQMVASGEVDHLVPERVWAETERALMCDEPAAFFYFLREIGALARLFPELDSLFGVPQPTRYHPEVDCGIHTLLVLSLAAAQGAGPVARYAALCHDYGKGLTPARILPGHRGHEERGVEPTDIASRRMGVPRQTRETACLAARWHTHLHRITQLTPDTVMTLFEALDVFRRPERLEDLIAVCVADVRGRLGYETRAYPQAEMARKALEAARALSGADVITHYDLTGPAVGEKLRELRVQAVHEAIHGRQTTHAS
mgnify:CR=1 FL=1